MCLLLFADDLAILAISKQGLEDKIDLLEKYWKDWGLKRNLKKTKILTFDKQGAVVNRHKFYFQVDLNFQSVLLPRVHFHTFRKETYGC